MTNSRGRIDLTQGGIIRQVLRFALPLCAGNVLQQLYTTVDTLVIGNYCSSEALAAVGTSSQPVELLLCLFMGLGGGVSILVSQCTGSGDTGRMRQVTATATSFLYLCAVPLTVLGILLGPQLLGLMAVPEDTMDLARTYLSLLLLGTLANLGYNTNAGVLRGMGDSTATLRFLVFSCGVNVAGDLLLVAGLGMGVAGAALATIGSQLTSWLLSVRYIRRRYPELDYSILPRRIHREELRQIVRIALPLGLNNSLYSLGHLVLQTMINTQGSAFMAACSVATRVTNISNVTITSLASAATTFSGQNLGAENYDRLYRGGRQIPLCSGGITLCLGLLMTAFCRPVLGLFTRDAAVLALAERYIRAVLPFFWTYTVFNSILSFVNGMGQVRYTTVVNLLMLWAVRVPVAWVITRFFDGTWVMVSYPISFTFGMICMLLFYFSRRWKEIRRLAGERTGGAER